MAEALAEYWHRRIREEWGFADEDGPTLAGLFRQQYRGGRYSWGYPACPDLEDNEKVAELLDADRIGIEVSEETGFQYQPEQTTVGHHLPPPQGQVLRRPVVALQPYRGADLGLPMNGPGSIAGLGIRFLGATLDALILVPVTLLSLALRHTRWVTQLSAAGVRTQRLVSNHLSTPATLLLLVPGAIYVIGLIGWRGQTLGEQIVGARVIRLSDRAGAGLRHRRAAFGRSPSPGRSCWRSPPPSRLVRRRATRSSSSPGRSGTATARACTTRPPASSWCGPADAELLRRRRAAEDMLAQHDRGLAELIERRRALLDRIAACNLAISGTGVLEPAPGSARPQRLPGRRAERFADPLPPTVADEPAASGYPLRVSVVDLLRATGEVLDLRELERLLRLEGIVVAGRPSQTLLNALRPALADGSVERVDRGRYRAA